MPYTPHGEPAAPGSETSYEAALRASTFVAAQGLRVYRWLQSRVDATQKEASTALGIDRASLCARFKALEDAGAIAKTSLRRAGCTAYQVIGPEPVQLGLLDAG